MAFSDDFRTAVQMARAPTEALAAKMDPATTVRPWLVMLRQVIRATEPLLGNAAFACMDREEEDAFCGELKLYYRVKREEEASHAGMLLEDLASIGETAPDSAPTNPFVAEMVGRQFYLIDFVHPAAFLGYIGFLEAFVPTVEQVTSLQVASGLPPSAFRTARVHAVADVEHWRELAEFLDSMPVKHRPDVLANALRCAALQFQALAQLAPASLSEEIWTP